MWLARREAAAAQHLSFTYALFDLGETEMLGCVDLEPDPTGEALGVVSWWVVDWLVDSPVERALDQLVPAWIATDWTRLPLPGLSAGGLAGDPQRDRGPRTRKSSSRRAGSLTQRAATRGP